jgi:hypothetical protein
VSVTPHFVPVTRGREQEDPWDVIRPVVHGDRLRDLQEADQLEPVQPLGAGLIAVDLRQTGVDREVGSDQAVDVGVPEEAADAVHHRVHRGHPESAVAEVAAESSTFARWMPTSGSRSCW